MQEIESEVHNNCLLNAEVKEGAKKGEAIYSNVLLLNITVHLQKAGHTHTHKKINKIKESVKSAQSNLRSINAALLGGDGNFSRAHKQVLLWATGHKHTCSQAC